MLDDERRHFVSGANGLSDVVDEIARAIGRRAAFDRLHVRGERAVAEDVLEPSREIVPPQVRRELGVRQPRRAGRRNPSAIARARPGPAVAGEDERLRLGDRHVEVLRAMPHVRGQPRGDLKPPHRRRAIPPRPAAAPLR